MASMIQEDLIKVINYPLAEIQPATEGPYYVGQTISVQSEETNPVKTYTWFCPETGEFSASFQFQIHPEKEGNHCIILKVDEAQCESVDTLCILIEPPFRIYIPNAFSPNGDGINDVFSPKGIAVKSSELYIYDRWGSTIHHDKSEAGLCSWDGGNFPQGAYKYVLLIATQNQQNQRLVGDLTLLR